MTQKELMDQTAGVQGLEMEVSVLREPTMHTNDLTIRSQTISDTTLLYLPGATLTYYF